MVQEYLLPILVLAGIGLLAGVVLVLAAKFMAVSAYEKYELVRALLPGACLLYTSGLLEAEQAYRIDGINTGILKVASPSGGATLSCWAYFKKIKSVCHTVFLFLSGVCL